MKIPSDQKPYAFTVVELLAATLILSVLSALIFPAAGIALQKAHLAETSSNYRQIAVALESYIDDHEECLPGPLTVAVFTFGRPTPSAGDTPHLGAYIAPYLNPSNVGENAGKIATNYPIKVLKCPLLSNKAQNDYRTANYVTLDYSPTQQFEDNRFGEWGGATFSVAAQKGIQPKRVVALSEAARRSPILSTADQANWISADNTLLPKKGAFSGKRLYLFLDGSCELSANPSIYQRR